VNEETNKTQQNGLLVSASGVRRTKVGGVWWRSGWGRELVKFYNLNSAATKSQNQFQLRLLYFFS